MKLLSTFCLALAISFIGCNVAGCSGGNSSSSQGVERDPEFKHKQPPKTQPPPPKHESPRK
jgi:hypothetical protein